MSDCVFCKIIAGELPCIKIHEDAQVLSFMDIHPLRRGHILTIPKQHQQQLHGLSEDIRAHLINTGARIAEALYHSELKPAAVHYMINDGPAAQQTVPHVHLHVLPRYQGDNLSFVARLLRKPFDMALGPTSFQKLQADAAAIIKTLG
jgi:diadenosine tetraphosphate (Ap4A) HIT family hydrolase